MTSLDRLFDVFSRERRRYALYVLDSADEPVEIEELAGRIRRLEEDGEDVSPGDLRDVRLSLKHTHLPKAAQAEYVEYDRDEGEIRISGTPTEFRVVLTVSEVLENPESPGSFDLETTTPEELLTKLSSLGQTVD